MSKSDILIFEDIIPEDIFSYVTFNPRVLTEERKGRRIPVFGDKTEQVIGYLMNGVSNRMTLDFRAERDAILGALSYTLARPVIPYDPYLHLVDCGSGLGIPSIVAKKLGDLTSDPIEVTAVDIKLEQIDKLEEICEILDVQAPKTEVADLIENKSLIEGENKILLFNHPEGQLHNLILDSLDREVPTILNFANPVIDDLHKYKPEDREFFESLRKRESQQIYDLQQNVLLKHPDVTLLFNPPI